MFPFYFSNLCFGQKQSYEDRKALADSFYNNNEYEHSLQIFDELLEKDSKNHYLLGRVGLCLYDLKNYQKAKEKFRLAALYCPVDENKTIAGYYANLSSCYSNLKENEKAYQYASKAYSLDDKSSQILWNAALNALNLGKYDECLNILDNAKIEKSNAFFSLYGQSYLSKGESKKAIENYENLLQNYEENNDVIKLDLLIQKRIFLMLI
ncbi:tetratricopeptide repeat protein [Chryseobacterium wanjuense]